MTSNIIIVNPALLLVGRRPGLVLLPGRDVLDAAVQPDRAVIAVRDAEAQQP